jgi:fructose-bisphosphate aldolase class II
MKILVDHALQHQYGIGAFNANNMEQIQAIMEAARETESPVIIQASRSALQYAQFTFFKYLILAAAEEYHDVPFAAHLDHGNSLAAVKKAIELGFSSVMIDGSLMEDGKTASTYEYNVEVTKSVVAHAHQYGVTVEGEIGTLGGIEDGVGSGEIHLTDPVQAKKFVAETGLDALAIAIGTSHGAYKFAAAPALAMNVVREIKSLMPDLPLVLHGASSVPRELTAKINQYGGEMANAQGVPVTNIQEAIKLGIAKINVDTDGRMAVTAAIREIMQKHPEKFDPRDYLKPAREALKELVAAKMKDFGACGRAKDIKPLSLAEAKKFYYANNGKIA